MLVAQDESVGFENDSSEEQKELNDLITIETATQSDSLSVEKSSFQLTIFVLIIISMVILLSLYVLKKRKG